MYCEVKNTLNFILSFMYVGLLSWMRSLSSRLLSKMFKSSRSFQTMLKTSKIKENGISNSTFEVPYTNGFHEEMNGYSSFSDSDSSDSDYSLSSDENDLTLCNGDVNSKEISIIKSNGLIVKEQISTYHCNVNIPILKKYFQTEKYYSSKFRHITKLF